MLLVCDLVSTDLKIAMPYSYKRFVAVVLLLCVFCCGVYTLSR